MKKRIIITESQLQFLLKESDKEYFFDEFKDDVLKFIKELLSNPANAKVSEKLESHDINRRKLIDSLIKVGILSRKQKVTEVENGEGKKESRMMTVYSANTDNATDKLEKAYSSFKLGKLYSESVNGEPVMDEEALFEVEMDEVDEAMAAGASNGNGGTWMGDASFTAPVKFGKKKDPAYDHTNMVRKSFNAYNPKTKKIDESIEEASDRSQYWKDRWAKQKAEGTVPDRSEYWKERAKKQKKQKPKRKINRNYHDHIGRLGTYDISNFMDDAMNMMSDNDWGEYFGDHD